MPPYQVSIIAGSIALKHSWFFQEDQNRGKPNWEHLNDDLHVLITVEDSENRASLKLQRAVDEVKKLLIVVDNIIYNCILIAFIGICRVIMHHMICLV